MFTVKPRQNVNFWDCFCTQFFIHSKADRTSCPVCKAEQVDQPDSTQYQIDNGVKVFFNDGPYYKNSIKATLSGYGEYYPDNGEKVARDVHNERLRQFVRRGFQDVSPAQFSAILGEEFGEVCKEINDNHFHGFNAQKSEALRAELVQTAAVCVQFIQWIDIQTGASPPLNSTPKQP